MYSAFCQRLCIAENQWPNIFFTIVTHCICHHKRVKHASDDPQADWPWGASGKAVFRQAHSDETKIQSHLVNVRRSGNWSRDSAVWYFPAVLDLGKVSVSLIDCFLSSIDHVLFHSPVYSQPDRPDLSSWIDQCTRCQYYVHLRRIFIRLLHQLLQSWLWKSIFAFAQLQTRSRRSTMYRTFWNASKDVHRPVHAQQRNLNVKRAYVLP